MDADVQPSSLQRVAAEGAGTMMLMTAVIGSGIMAERMAGGNAAIALLANTAATVAALYVLIEVLEPVSGAHFNPVVSVVMAWRRALPPGLLAGYVLAQLVGAVSGAWLAHAMFEMSIVQFSSKVRTGSGQWLGEGIATFGLLFVILRASTARTSVLVACYVGAAYWFTSSTSFANPAAAVGRMFSDSFAGIAPRDVPAFIAAELCGAALAVLAHRLLGGTRQSRALA